MTEGLCWCARHSQARCLGGGDGPWGYVLLSWALMAGVRGAIAHGDGQRCRGIRYPEDRGKTCVDGDGRVGFDGRATSLTGCVRHLAAVWCFGAGDGHGHSDPLGEEPTQRLGWRAQGARGALIAVSVNVCLLAVRATTRALVVAMSVALRVF
jgi:hypothetical protein